MRTITNGTTASYNDYNEGKKITGLALTIQFMRLRHPKKFLKKSIEENSVTMSK